MKQDRGKSVNKQENLGGSCLLIDFLDSRKRQIAILIMAIFIGLDLYWLKVIYSNIYENYINNYIKINKKKSFNITSVDSL